jgi:putative transposase
LGRLGVRVTVRVTGNDWTCDAILDPPLSAEDQEGFDLLNGKLARAISDAAWRDMRTMLEYKCAWYGRDLVVVDRWFPSSKLCGTCGTIRAKLPLNVREWTCHCGTVHDRDVNAARNILAAGLAVTACGDGVRPQRESSRTGQSSVKQETQRATAGIPHL